MDSMITIWMRRNANFRREVAVQFQKWAATSYSKARRFYPPKTARERRLCLKYQSHAREMADKARRVLEMEA